jgi:hypothetical protein
MCIWDYLAEMCSHLPFATLSPEHLQVLNGEGYGVVVRCGDNTYIGKINQLASETSGTETTLQRDINFFVKVIAAIAITMAVVLFSAGMGRKMKFESAFVNGVVVVLVANIPQGLPATVTSALTLTAERMKVVSVLVKKTDIIEALGSATRIASDKTGVYSSSSLFHVDCHKRCAVMCCLQQFSDRRIHKRARWCRHFDTEQNDCDELLGEPPFQVCIRNHQQCGAQGVISPS